MKQFKEEEEINYFKEMLTSQTSVLGMFGAIGLGAVLSIPLGLGFAAIPPLLFCAGGAIASMFIPSSPVFQEKVRRAKRKERMERIENELLASLEPKARERDPKWKVYWMLREHWEAMVRFAKESGSLSQSDLDSFEEATLNYLGMWLALLSTKESSQAIDIGDIKQRIKDIDHQLSKQEGSVNRKKLEQAGQEYRKILQRHKDLDTRIISLEARMESMKHNFEEIYQRLISGQLSSSVEIQDALGRMRVEEELDMAVDTELEALFANKSTTFEKRKKKIAEKARKKRKI